MINKKRLFVFFVCIIPVILTGCLTGTETIDVEYLPGFKAQKMFINYEPTIALNPIWDERQITDRIGEGYNFYGNKIETWITGRSPTEIIEAALITQLEDVGFKVIRTSGWNLDPSSIAEYIKSDFIMGGKLKTFWVESRPGIATVSVNSRITFDLLIADVENKKIVWAGQFTGSDKSEAILRTNNHMKDSLSRALTESINKIFQNDEIKNELIRLVEIKF